MANKIGDTSMGGDRITKLGDAQVSDDACTLAQALSAAGDVNSLILKFSGKITLGVGATVGYCGDVPGDSVGIPIGYAMPRAYHLSDLYLNFFVNTASVPTNVKVFKNGIATALAISGIAPGFTGKSHLGLALPGIAFAADDLLDIELSGGIGTGDIGVTAMVFGTKDA